MLGFQRLRVALLGMIVSCGCASSTPSEGDGREVVQHQIERSSNGLIRLASFAKTNA